MNPLSAQIAFASYRNINIAAASRFESLGVEASDFFTLPSSRLATLTGMPSDYFDDGRRAKALAEADREANYINRKGINALYYSSAGYPQRLRHCDDAPAMLYSFGEIKPAPKHVVAIVGTRHCTAYGAAMTKALVDDLAAAVPDLLIVSGLAYGVDIAAHRAALAAGVPTGAVVAHGLNTLYPADHRNDARRIVTEGGFVATEYCSDAPIHRANFLARNRIVAGMADVTVIIESDFKGGAMATARTAAAYGREVMAVPGRATDTYSRGCNALLANQTASILRDASDLINLLQWKTEKAPAAQPTLPFLTDEQELVLKVLAENPSATVNDLCSTLAIPYPKLTALLFDMEMADLVTPLPGGRYAPTISAR